MPTSRSASSALRSASPADASSGASCSSGATARSAAATRSAPPCLLVGRDRGERRRRAGGQSSVTCRSRSRSARSSSSRPGLRPSVSSASARSSSSRASAAAASRVSSSWARRAAASSRQARRAARAGLGRAGEGVEHRELVARPREPPLLELAAHREQRLDGGRDVLARRAPAPGVGARPPVGEDPPRERRATSSPSGRSSASVAEHLVVREVELGLDVGLLRGGADQRRRRRAPRAAARSRSRGSSSPPPSRR